MGELTRLAAVRARYAERIHEILAAAPAPDPTLAAQLRRIWKGRRCVT